jgi:hypothetical protein
MASPKQKELKEKIFKNLTHYLDLMLELLPENRDQAETILHAMHELVQEKRLNPTLLWKHMEEPLYFQESGLHEFTRQGPLIAKIARSGGLVLFNYYLSFKYGTFLTENLLQHHEIFLFKLPPIKNYIDQSKWPIIADNDDKYWIRTKYYDEHGMTYDLLGDVFQEAHIEILAKLVECHFNFNNPVIIERLNQYFYMNRENEMTIPEDNLTFLLQQGLNPSLYIDMLLQNVWDMFSLPILTPVSDVLVRMASFMLDHGATTTLSVAFMMKLHQILEHHVEKLDTALQKKYSYEFLKAVWYLQGQLLEQTTSFANAQPYYVKSGEKGYLKIREHSEAMMQRLAAKNRA